jgi:uncharacterized coiled-coil protein SlyX
VPLRLPEWALGTTRQLPVPVVFPPLAFNNSISLFQIDFAIQTLNNMITERQKKYAKYAEQIQKVQEVSTVLTRIKMNVDELIPLMERLNSVLPPDDQLEPFVMKPPKTG